MVFTVVALNKLLASPSFAHPIHHRFSLRPPLFPTCKKNASCALRPTNKPPRSCILNGLKGLSGDQIAVSGGWVLIHWLDDSKNPARESGFWFAGITGQCVNANWRITFALKMAMRKLLIIKIITECKKQMTMFTPSPSFSTERRCFTCFRPNCY